MNNLEENVASRATVEVAANLNSTPTTPNVDEVARPITAELLPGSLVSESTRDDNNVSTAGSHTLFESTQENFSKKAELARLRRKQMEEKIIGYDEDNDPYQDAINQAKQFTKTIDKTVEKIKVKYSVAKGFNTYFDELVDALDYLYISLPVHQILEYIIKATVNDVYPRGLLLPSGGFTHDLKSFDERMFKTLEGAVSQSLSAILTASGWEDILAKFAYLKDPLIKYDNEAKAFTTEIGCSDTS